MLIQMKTGKSLSQKYPSFKKFNENFSCDEAFMTEFLAMSKKEDETLEMNEEEYIMKKRLNSD